MPDETKIAKKTAVKTIVTPEIRRLWFPIRRSWSMGVAAFSNSISSLNEKQAVLIYDIVKLPLYLSLGDAQRRYPGLKAILSTEDDRLCMFQVYENLSWRLGKSEPKPKDVRLIEGLKGGIGRASPNIEL